MRAFALASLLPLLLTIGSTSLADDRSQALELNTRGIAKFKAGDVDGALTLFREALALDKADAVIKKNTAHCLLLLGDKHLGARRFSEAARDYHEAGGLTPKDPRPFVREGLALYRQLKLRDAIALLTKTVQAHPKEVQAHVLLAQALYKLGENKKAVEHWEIAAKLDPKDARIKTALAKAKKDEKIEENLYTDLGAAHFTIKYDGQADREVGKAVVLVLEDAYKQVGLLLGRYPAHEVAVVVYPAKTFRAATGAHGWVAGLYDGKIKVPANGLAKAQPEEIRRVLFHEYAHALLRAVGGPRVPVWLHEGFAQVAEGRSRLVARRGLSQANAPTRKALTTSFLRTKDAKAVRLQYGAACDLVHHLLGQGGYPALADLLDRLAKKEPLDKALRWVYAQTLDELVAAWKLTLPLHR